MKHPKYAKTFEELEAVASKFWPTELSEIESKLSIIPLLLKTQDQFINIISVQTNSLEKLFTVIESACLSPSLFVKHLVILADFGGEMLQRISNEFENLFPSGELHYLWREEPRTYKFRALPEQRMSNKSLKIDGKELFKECDLSDLQRDAIALLLFGSAYSDENQELASALSKCEIGEYLGKDSELKDFLRQRYIWLSQNKVTTVIRNARNKISILLL